MHHTNKEYLQQQSCRCRWPKGFKPERFFESDQSGRSCGRYLKVGAVKGIEIYTYL